MKRECGMLLPVSSLPSAYGIGAFSKEAYEFVDLLKRAGQSYWQILPLGPTGFGDSPYQSFSAFAGNPYFIDLGALIRDGLLTQEECDRADFGSNRQDIDYQKLSEQRFPLLRQAFERWREQNSHLGEVGISSVLTEKLHPETLEYCLYMAIKDEYQGKSWDLWDIDIRMRQPEAVGDYRAKLWLEIQYYQFQQYLFTEQWQKLKAYANKQGIRIIGDIPIYVSFDSADTWSHPELFQLDESGKPFAVAGCPPDGFSATGQLWGNPLYQWEIHRDTGYRWWLDRMGYSFELYDVIRVDHFRGFDEYYAIPYGHETAQYGHWEIGPGIELFNCMKEAFPHLDIIAEDLGYLTPTVLKLVEDTGFPGMKVLEFAFSADGTSIYLPYHYTQNCVVYTGTHDNDTLHGWYEKMSREDREFTQKYLGNEYTPEKEIHWDFIRLALSSTARLAIIPVQDYLGLGSEARINEPSTLGKNWRWRLAGGELDEGLVQKCNELARIYGR